MPITAIIGPMRSGKTLIATRMALAYIRAGVRVYANYAIRGMAGHIDLPTLNRLIKKGDTSWLKGCVIVIDEIQTEMDSRSSGRVENRTASYFVLQTGKLQSILVWTSQHYGQADVRLRIHTDTRVDVQRLRLEGSTLVPAVPSSEPRPWYARVTTSVQVDGWRGMEFRPVRQTVMTEKDMLETYDSYDTGEAIFPSEREAKD